MSNKGISKIGVFFFLLLFFCANFISGFNNVSSILDEIYSSQDYTLVLGSGISSSEVASCAEFAGMFRIEKGKLDSEISIEEENLILVGNSNNNSLVKSLIGDWNFTSGESLVRIYNSSNSYFLIVAGTNPEDTVNAINKIKEYSNYVNFSKYSETKIIGNFVIGVEILKEEIQNPPVDENLEEGDSSGSGGGGGGGGGGSNDVPEEKEKTFTENGKTSIIQQSEKISSSQTQENNEEDSIEKENLGGTEKEGIENSNKIKSNKWYIVIAIGISIIVVILLCIFRRRLFNKNGKRK